MQAKHKSKSYYIIRALSFIRGKTADLGSRLHTPVFKPNVIVETQQRLIGRSPAPLLHFYVHFTAQFTNTTRADLTLTILSNL